MYLKFEFNCRKRRKRECILRGLRPRIGEGEFCSAEACFIFRKFPTRVTDFFGEDVTFVHRSLAYTLSNHFFIFGRRLQAISGLRGECHTAPSETKPHVPGVIYLEHMYMCCTHASHMLHRDSNLSLPLSARLSSLLIAAAVLSNCRSGL